MNDIEFDEGRLLTMSKEERNRLTKEFMDARVDKRCETCGFYAVFQKDILDHAGKSGHGFMNRGLVVHVLVLEGRTAKKTQAQIEREWVAKYPAASSRKGNLSRLLSVRNKRRKKNPVVVP